MTHTHLKLFFLSRFHIMICLKHGKQLLKIIKPKAVFCKFQTNQFSPFRKPHYVQFFECFNSRFFKLSLCMLFSLNLWVSDSVLGSSSKKPHYFLTFFAWNLYTIWRRYCKTCQNTVSVAKLDECLKFIKRYFKPLNINPTFYGHRHRNKREWIRRKNHVRQRSEIEPRTSISTNP